MNDDISPDRIPSRTPDPPPPLSGEPPRPDSSKVPFVVAVALLVLALIVGGVGSSIGSEEGEMWKGLGELVSGVAITIAVIGGLFVLGGVLSGRRSTSSRRESHEVGTPLAPPVLPPPPPPHTVAPPPPPSPTSSGEPPVPGNGSTRSGCANSIPYVLGGVSVFLGLVLIGAERGQEFCGQEGYEFSCSLSELLYAVGILLFVAGVGLILAGIVSSRVSASKRKRAVFTPPGNRVATSIRPRTAADRVMTIAATVQIVHAMALINFSSSGGNGFTLMLVDFGVDPAWVFVAAMAMIGSSVLVLSGRRGGRESVVALQCALLIYLALQLVGSAPSGYVLLSSGGFYDREFTLLNAAVCGAVLALAVRARSQPTA